MKDIDLLVLPVRIILYWMLLRRVMSIGLYIAYASIEKKHQPEVEDYGNIAVVLTKIVYALVGIAWIYFVLLRYIR